MRPYGLNLAKALVAYAQEELAWRRRRSIFSGVDLLVSAVPTGAQNFHPDTRGRAPGPAPASAHRTGERCLIALGKHEWLSFFVPLMNYEFNPQLRRLPAEFSSRQRPVRGAG